MIGGRGSGESDTDLIIAAAAIAAAATATAAFWLLQLAFWIASGISATATWPTLADLAAVLGLHLLSDAEHATAVDGARGLFWAVAAVLETSLILILVVGGLASWRRWGPTPAGHATRAQIRRELSVQACRRAAERTRPGLTAVERRSAVAEDIGIPLPKGPAGHLYAPFENPSGTLAPTQTGKSRRFLAPICLAAPGALLCSTTKPDLLMLTAMARSRRQMPGPILVFDATGTVQWPAKLRWSPVAGCERFEVAERRARTMVEASAVFVESSGGTGAGNDRVFRERAVGVLAAYLVAAAKGGHGIARVVGWGLSRSDEPIELLEYEFPDRARNLRAEMSMVAETSDAVWMSVRRVLAPFQDSTLSELCSPGPGEEFDAQRFIGLGGTLYLIAGQREDGAIAPVLTALAEEWIDAARSMALRYPSERLDPPATVVLDELPSATPVPDLPATLADSAGRGVLIHWAAQSKAQLDNTFGRDRATMLLDNSALMAVWGGLKDGSTLQWLSSILGDHERDRVQSPTGLFGSGRGATRSRETVPTFRPSAVRTVERGATIIVFRHLRAILGRTVDIYDRKDGDQLRDDVETVGTGRPPIDSRGYPSQSDRLGRPERGGVARTNIIAAQTTFKR
ncbi:TraM recognition domain-containing protein [Pseudonocardia tropica]|uniref:TraM recognition domain-containing protein n=1 Tax=Pseudonocardia tropica TaxID=681289 RepID=A0ABV1K2E5_9PSEU